MTLNFSVQDHNKALVRASFDRWRDGTGGPFELFRPGRGVDDRRLVAVVKALSQQEEFIDEVIDPFNARMAKPLVPAVRGIYADGDTVVILFDASATAKDGVPYHNTYTWYFQMKGTEVVKTIAFFDTRDFDEFSTRVSPKP